MAISSTMAYACMPHYRDIVTSLSKHTPSNVAPLKCTIPSYYVNIAMKKASYLRLIVRSSDGDASETTTATATETWEGDEGSSVEVAKGPPSLISTLNVEKALRGIGITDVDHYGILGIRRGCSYEQVRAAYQDKVKELTSQELDEEELNKAMELVKESYRILSTEEERRLYDWSLARNESPERFVWPFEVDLTQTPVDGTPPAQEPEDVGPTAVVGYFLLGWFILACILSIALNR